MPESFTTLLLRFTYNFFPAYRGTGARIVYIASDFREIRIKLPLSWRTRNYVGTIYGGSLYGAVDPIYMMMLIKTLGPGYEVWDKSAMIRFLKPGRNTLYAHFRITPSELDEIRAALNTQPSIDRSYHIELADAAGVVHAVVDKVIHIRKKEPTLKK